MNKKLNQKKQTEKTSKKLPQRDSREALEAKVEGGVKKAVKQYREAFRILANYDRQ